MEAFIYCPYCDSRNTQKTSNGKFTDGLAKTGSFVGGGLLQGLTGLPGILGVNLGYKHTWHQYICQDCGEVFKVRMHPSGAILEIKKY